MVETLWVHLDLVDLVVVADERGVSAAYMYSARQPIALLEPVSREIHLTFLFAHLVFQMVCSHLLD
jgi:hypothetical protein